MRTTSLGNVSIAPRQHTAQLLITGREPQPTRHVPHKAVDVLLPIAFFINSVLETLEYQLAPPDIDRIGDGSTQ